MRARSRRAIVNRQSSIVLNGHPRSNRQHTVLQGLAPGSRAPDADEQPRPRGRGAARGPDRLRRRRQGGAELGRATDAIVATLRRLGDDETLLVQSGKPVGVFRTHEEAPRVLIANANLVPRWATWDEFRRLDALGLTMYGQMTAGSWIYIGTQGILQGTYETFAELARQHFGGSLAGRLVVTGGLGGMGGAQPLAATMNGAAFLGVDVDESRIRRRVETGYCDRICHDLDEALAPGRGRASRGAGALGRPGRQHRRGAAGARAARRRARTCSPTRPRRTTCGSDTSPSACRWRRPRCSARPTPRATSRAVLDSMVAHVRAMLELQRGGAVTFDYGNNLRGQVADRRGMLDAFDIPGFVPEFIRPLFCRGAGPFRWVALSGDPADIAVTDDAVLETFPDKEPLARWIRAGTREGALPGTAGADLLARVRRAGGDGHRVQLAGARPGGCRPRSSSAAIISIPDRSRRPTAKPKAMKDGSDAIADWPLLNALLNTACGASWVSLHHGGGVGIGYSIHAGMVDGGRRHRARRPAAGAGAHGRPGDRSDAARGCGVR